MKKSKINFRNWGIGDIYKEEVPFYEAGVAKVINYWIIKNVFAKDNLLPLYTLECICSNSKAGQSPFVKACFMLRSLPKSDFVKRCKEGIKRRNITFVCKMNDIPHFHTGLTYRKISNYEKSLKK